MAFLAASPRSYTNTVTDPDSKHRNVAKISHLGLSVACEAEREQIEIDERDYPQKKKFEMHSSEERATPMESKPVPRRQGGEPADHNWYHQAVGHALYDARISRPISILGPFAGDPSDRGTLLYNDNQSAVFHHLADCTTKHELAIEYVPTGAMRADGLTKALGGVKHREFLNTMGIG